MEIENKITSLIEKSYAIRSSDIEKSIALVNQAIALCQDDSLRPLRALAFSRLSLYYMIVGKYDESYNFTQKSIHIFEKLNDEIGLAHAKYNLGGFYYKTNDFQMGVVCLVDALIIYKKHNDHHNISRCEKALGAIYDFTGDVQKAIQAHSNAIRAAKKANDPDLESNAMINMSGIYLKSNQVALASEMIENAIAIKKNTGDMRGVAFGIYGRAKIYLAQEKYHEAEANFFEAISMHTKMQEKFGLAMAYNKLARLYFETNNSDNAKKYAAKSLEICDSYNIAMIKIKALHLFYTIHKAENDLQHALVYLEKYLLEKESVFNAQNIKVIESYDLLMRMQALQKDTEFQQERTKLIDKTNKIEQAAKVRQEFLSTMSHEIRTPLNAVTTIASMLSERPGTDDKVLIDSLKFSSNHLMQIINDILDFTKLDLGKMTLEMESKNIKSYLHHFWSTYQIQAKEKGIELLLKLDERLYDHYFIDQTKLTQILGNLVSNAIKFTDAGHVKLEIKAVAESDEHDTILFKISDTGVGIEKANIDRIFESFSQLKNGITRKKDGTGLGLSISKKLIELHESQISIQSNFGKGSVFSFELKLKKSIPATPDAPADIEEAIAGVKVMLVEDNAINALIALKLLSQWSIKADHAKNGLEATEMSRQKKYDYILMDIHMPVLDGYEAAKNIRTLPNLNKETPIFGLTADISAKDNAAYSGYFNGFLLKPLEIEKLKIVLSSR